MPLGTVVSGSNRWAGTETLSDKTVSFQTHLQLTVLYNILAVLVMSYEPHITVTILLI